MPCVASATTRLPDDALIRRARHAWRRPVRVRHRLAGALTIAVLTVACGSDTPTDADPTRPTAVVVVPQSVVMDTSQVVRFRAYGRNAAGDSMTVDVRWTVSGGTIMPEGRYVAAAIPGVFRVIATHEPTGIADTALATVTDEFVPVASVEVVPASVTLAEGDTVRLTANALDDEGNTLAGRAITWRTSDADVATVSPSGLVTGMAVGGASIIATSEGESDTADITVTALAEPTVFVGAGDIAVCGGSGDERTADLLDAIDGTVFTTGDNAYPDGSASNFTDCYEPSWGRHKHRTRPTAGNHDYHTSGASAYFAYFGANAGEPGKGYYSFDLGDWHVIALNSAIAMSVGSAQEQWLRADLAASDKQCTIAYWHHPRFSSGDHGNDAAPGPLWEALYEAGAELVLVGHDHNYERFAPQTPSGDPDPQTGIRQIVVGTGGAGLRTMNAPVANSEVRNSDTHGALKLTLTSGSYQWEFVPVAGKGFTDQGSGVCH